MKRKAAILSIILMFASHFCLAQDKIVTIEKDTIICKILNVDDFFITYEIREDANQAVTKSINKNNISSIEYKNLPEKTKYPKQKRNVDRYKYQSFRLAMDLGFSHITSEIEESGNDDLDDHSRKLKNGFNYGITGAYFWEPTKGFGAKVNKFNSSNTVDILVTYEDMTSEYVTVEEEISITYFGPVYYISTDPEFSGVRLIGGVSLGYLNFKDKMNFLQGPSIDLIGENLGVGVSFGSDFMLAKNFAIGLELEGIFGSFTEVDIDNTSYELEESMGCSRFNFNIGFRIY